MLTLEMSISVSNRLCYQNWMVNGCIQCDCTVL